MNTWDERLGIDRRPLDPHLFDNDPPRPRAAEQGEHGGGGRQSDPDDAFYHDYQTDGRTQGPLVPPEIAARMRWAGNYILPGLPQLTSFWAAEVALDETWTTPDSTGFSRTIRLPQGCVLLRDVLIDTSEYQMQQRQGAQMPVLVTRRRTWRRELHLYGAVLLWAEMSEKQRQQARG